MTDGPRVVANLLWVAPGRVGGSEEYLVRQLAALPDLDVEIVCTPAFAAAHAGLVETRRTRIVPLHRDSRALRIAAEHTLLAAATRSADVVHHGGGTAPLVGRRPFVLTIHDLQYRDLPANFGRARLAYLRRAVPRSIRRAAAVTCPSEFVRSTILDTSDLDPDDVVVVPHGVPAIEAPAVETIAAVRERYGLGEHAYVVYPAITHPHKRHELLVDMLGHLEPGVRLVVLGGIGDGEATLQRRVAASPLRDHVIRPGRVSDADRDALVAGAEALVFPSEYEGFGAPLVEAMVLGTPVVARAAAAIPEVVGDAGVLVAGDDPAAWAGAVDEARSRRAELVTRGRQRARDFTAEASGAALRAVYVKASES